MSFIKKAVTALIILIVAAYIVVNRLANERLPGLLGEKVQAESVQVNLLGRQVHFKNPSFRLRGTDKAPDLKIYSTARGVTISGISLWDLLISKKIGVKKLAIDSLNVDIRLPDHVASEPEKEEINLFVTDIFNRIQVDHFELSRGNVLVGQQDSLHRILSLAGLNLRAHEIVVDTATVHNVFPLEFGKSEVYIEDLYVQPDAYYTITGKNLHISDTSFEIDSIRLRPLYSRAEFTRRHPYEVGQVNLFTPRLTSRRFLWDVNADGEWKIRSEKIALDTLDIQVFQDKRPPQEPPRIKPLLTGVVRSLPVSLRIDTLVLRDSYIAYEEHPADGPGSGRVYFDRLYMTASNITNDSARIRDHPTTTLDIICRFMDKGALETVIKLDMSAARQAFAVTGSLGKMPLTYANEALVPLIGVDAAGSVERLDFQFSGDDYASTGKISFHYSDLQVKVLDEAREKEWLKSMLGNFVLKNDNTREGRDYKEGEIYFVRYQNKSFFNYLWNSLRVGLLDTVLPIYQNPDKSTPPESPKYKKDS